MKPGATVLIAEPAGHVSETEFAEEIEVAVENGLKVIDRPFLNRCNAALLQKI
jgi:hypothetical protein